MGGREEEASDAKRKWNEGLTGDGNSTESELGLDVEDTRGNNQKARKVSSS